MSKKRNLLLLLLVLSLFMTPGSSDKSPTAYANHYQSYVVEYGDTLWRIASVHGVELHDLMSVNNKTGDTITPGEVLTIPNSPASYETTESNRVYGTELTDKEYTVLLEVVQQESGGHNYEAVLAVMSVITNRVDSPWYQDTVWEVVTAPGQFEAYGAGHYTRHRGQVTDTTIQGVEDALQGKKNVSVLNFWSDWYYIEQGRQDAEAVNIGGNIFFDYD